MVPREFRHPLLVSLLALYALVVGHRLGGWARLPPVLTSYAADLACLPLVLTLALVLMRYGYFRNPRFVLPPTWIFATWLAVAGWFEGVLPLLRPTATADALDVLAYALGALAFHRWLNRPGS